MDGRQELIKEDAQGPPVLKKSDTQTEVVLPADKSIGKNGRRLKVQRKEIERSY